VVIPAFDHADHVAAAVRSALRLDGVDEVVVVDDGSRTPLTLLWFLDGDDELLDGATDGSRGWEGSLYRFGYERVHEDGRVERRFARAGVGPYPRGTPLAGSFAIDRELFRQIGGYDVELRFAENTELLLRAQAQLQAVGAEPLFIERATILYRPSTGGGPRYPLVRAMAAERIMAKHGSLLSPADRRDHWSIAATVYQRCGDRRNALRCALAAWRLAPLSPRSAGRVLRSLATRSR
jgi:hypothetical protein